jgi:hypothetical protein
MKRALTAWLFAACAVAGFGCSDEAKTQVLTGRVSTQGAIAVRAVDGTTIITAARVRSDGTFTLSLPAGHRYRLEVLTSDGVHNVVATKSGTLSDITFKVCEPQPPWDMGGFGEPGCDPMDPNSMCGDPPPPCDPNDPDCKPYPCDPNTDPMCVPCDPMDPTCGGTTCDPMTDPNCQPPPPPCDPTTDPNCKCDPMTDPSCVPPPPCDPMTDPNCGGGCDPSDPNCQPPCDPMTDPMCKCYPGDPDCPVCDPTDPNCGTTCDPMVDPMCPTPPPPCEDPMDPNTCKDPCMIDPVSCGCGMDPTYPTMPDGTTDNTCWPPPEPCTMESCPDDPWQPEKPPGDFGCGDDTMTLPGGTMPGEDGTK